MKAKKTVKEGIVFNTFDKSNNDSAFAIVNIRNKFKATKVVERETSSKYLYSMLNRSFLSVVRITAIVIIATRKLKK